VSIRSTISECSTGFKGEVVSVEFSTQLKSLPIILWEGAVKKKVGNSVLKRFSLSLRRAKPDGAYTFISLRPLYSADMAHLDGSLWTFVIGIAFLRSIAVPRIEVPIM